MMASDVPKSVAMNVSQQNSGQHDGASLTNASAQNNLYQQFNALAGLLNNAAVTTGNSSRSLDSVTSNHNNVSVLNQLLSLSASVDATTASRPTGSSASQEMPDGSTLSNLLLNPQFTSLLSAALQKMEPSSAQQRASPIVPIITNSIIGTPPLNNAMSDPQKPPVGADETQVSRMEEITDPNVIKLQKLLTALSAASTGQSINTATSPNHLSVMQWLTSAIQQQAQMNRTNNPQLSTPIPSSITQTATTNSSAVKNISSTGDMIYKEPYVTTDGRVLLQVSNIPTATGISPHSSSKTRHQTNGHIFGRDGTAVSASINGHSSKTLVPLPPQPLLSQMQTWSLPQLEKHVNALSESNQPIPQAVTNLLIDFRRREDKRNAKRVANRKSACTSRARKKALVEEMTRTNERLKRQALILSLLPDLVISITVEGEITFCSDQVERVLHHKVTDLCGANIDDIIVPASRDALHRLMKNLAAAAEQAEASSGSGCSEQEGSGGGSETAAIISEASSGSLVSFPLSEVNVKNYNRQLQLENQNRVSDSSDFSHHKVSTSSGNNSVSRSATQSSFGNHSNGYSSTYEARDRKEESVYRKSSDDESDSKRCDKESSIPESSDKSGSNANNTSEALSNRGDDSCSSLSADNGKEQKKSFESMECSEQKKCESSGHGTSKHFEERSSSSSSEISVDEKRVKSGSDDSGYRESAESENSETDGSNSNDIALKSRPLAPTCNICLIREDLSTLWCEVTSSIHTTSLFEERSIVASSKRDSVCSKDQESEGHIVSRKELLLCLRPIRDGTEKVTEELKFRPPIKEKNEELDIHPDDADMESESVGYPSDTPRGKPSHNGKDSSKKRQHLNPEGGSSRKKFAAPNVSNDTEKTVAESLMLMSYFQ